MLKFRVLRTSGNYICITFITLQFFCRGENLNCYNSIILIIKMVIYNLFKIKFATAQNTAHFFFNYLI